MNRGVRRRRCGALLLAVVLAGGASGCGVAGDGPGPGTPPAPGGPAPGATTEDPRPAGTLVEVVVTGGFAGVHNRLVVRHDGGWTVESGTKPPRTGRQTPAETAELRTALTDPAYALVPPRPTGRPVADGFRYEVTHRHRVVVADDDPPPALRRVFAALPEGGPPTSP